MNDHYPQAKRPTFAELIRLFESGASNASIGITDARRFVILEALRIADESGKDCTAFRHATMPAPPFDLSQLTFPERYVLAQLRDGPIEVWGAHVNQPAHVLKNSGLITMDELTGDRAGTVILTITAKGQAAR